jgi:anaerobic magnesium-protoporphyrin IX monomethyl ester cyclase
MMKTGDTLRVLLVNPAPREVVQGGWYRMPLLGLGYCAAYLRERGYECRIVDAIFEKLNPEQTMTRIRDYNPSLLGCTAMTHEVNRAARIAAEARRTIPDLKTVIGGPHATAIPEETLREYDAFDFAVFGEGEETLAELVRAIGEGSSVEGIAGLAYRAENGEIRRNKPRPWKEDLDDLPFPAWDLYPPAREYQIFSSRGCPYRCSFCMRVLGEVVRYRSVESVVREFELVTERYGPREISFSDEIFTLDEQRAIAICDQLIAKGLHRKTPWFANARANCTSSALYRKLREAGCVRVGVGIESGNQAILNRIRKGITLERAREMVRIAKEAGLKVAAFFIIGHPGETEDTIRDTIAFARELQPSAVAFGIMVPYPGTEIAAMASRGEGGYKIVSRNWSDYDKYFGSALELENVSRRQLEKWQARAYLYFYLFNFRVFSLIRFLWSRRQGVAHYIRRLLWRRA